MDEIRDELAQVYEPAVKKVLGALQNRELWPWQQAINPVDRLIDIDELVFVALHDQPGTIRLFFQASPRID